MVLAIHSRVKSFLGVILKPCSCLISIELTFPGIVFRQGDGKLGPLVFLAFGFDVHSIDFRFRIFDLRFEIGNRQFGYRQIIS